KGSAFKSFKAAIQAHGQKIEPTLKYAGVQRGETHNCLPYVLQEAQKAKGIQNEMTRAETGTELRLAMVRQIVANKIENPAVQVVQKGNTILLQRPQQQATIANAAQQPSVKGNSAAPTKQPVPVVQSTVLSPPSSTPQPVTTSQPAIPTPVQQPQSTKKPNAPRKKKTVTSKPPTVAEPVVSAPAAVTNGDDIVKTTEYLLQQMSTTSPSQCKPIPSTLQKSELEELQIAQKELQEAFDEDFATRLQKAFNAETKANRVTNEEIKGIFDYTLRNSERVNTVYASHSGLFAKIAKVITPPPVSNVIPFAPKK
ncbi:MAG TPA: hypothetical protein VHZ76_07025, partial [Gammaproteobacteria bacterium]|nr:hypothetical protein [Gammaproteobacteria bacterium]